MPDPAGTGGCNPVPGRMMLAVLKRKMRSFLRRSTFEQLWFLPALALLGLSRAAILTVSFRRLAPGLGRPAGVSPWLPILSRRDEQLAVRIGRAVRLAARYTPWQSNCFPQAVTARILLGLYGVPYVLFFGLARTPGDGDMMAHAWVAAGRTRVTGGHGFGQFTVVGCFVAPALAGALAGRQ